MSDIISIQEQFGKHLLNFIKTRVNSEDDAQDIYQEVIVKIINKSDKIDKPQSLKSWLFTIAKNQIIDYYRLKKPNDDINMLVNVEHQQDDKTYNELEGCLASFIEALPNNYRDIIKLSEIEGKSQKEVAEALGVNYVTLRSKVQRGREKIKKMIFDSCAIELDKSGGVVDCSPKSSGCGDGMSQTCSS